MAIMFWRSDSMKCHEHEFRTAAQACGTYIPGTVRWGAASLKCHHWFLFAFKSPKERRI